MNKDTASGERWMSYPPRDEVAEIMRKQPKPVWPDLRMRVSEALALEFNQEAARWATDSVIEAVFGKDFSDD